MTNLERAVEKMQDMQSIEDYLETILLLSKTSEKIKNVDIVNATGYSKPSISIAMKKLKDKNYINISNGEITLTKLGKEIATNVYSHHKTLYNWLISIGVSSENAEKDACKMEHNISNESFLAIKRSCEFCRCNSCNKGV